MEIIEIKESYFYRVWLEPEMRNQHDLDYEFADQSVILDEIRLARNKPKEIRTYGYAKVP